MANIIEASNVNKSYGLSPALKNLSLSVKKSTIFALIGPNGAGKTTFIKSVLNLVKPNSGSITINGIDAKKAAARQGIAYLPEKFSFFPYYSVEGVVRFYGQMQNLRGLELKKSTEEALNKLNIWELRKRKLRTLSKGQLQRTGISTLLMGDNKLLIIDEPFSGIDPIGIKELKVLFLELKASGKTVFINSHILSETEQICDDVAILNRGECLASGNMRDMIGTLSLEDFFYKLVKK